MPYGTITAQELADMLGTDRRLLERQAQRGEIPCQKVQGQLRFNRAQIRQWLKEAIPGMNRQRLAEVDAGMAAQSRMVQEGPIIEPLLRDTTVCADLKTRTKSSTLHNLIGLAEQSGLVYDIDALRQGVLHREDIASTALPNGVAIPHPHGPLPYALADCLLVVARTTQAIVFGGPFGAAVNLFFLTASPDSDHHLHILARLCRLLQDEQILEDLRTTTTANEMIGCLSEGEASVLSEKRR